MSELAVLWAGSMTLVQLQIRHIKLFRTKVGEHFLGVGLVLPGLYSIGRKSMLNNNQPAKDHHPSPTQTLRAIKHWPFVSQIQLLNAPHKLKTVHCCPLGPTKQQFSISVGYRAGFTLSRFYTPL